MSETLNEWAGKIAGKNIELKKRLIDDMTKYGNQYKSGQITIDEYENFGKKFKEIASDNFFSQQEALRNYEQKKKEVIRESKVKKKGFFESMKNKIGIGTKVEKKFSEGSILNGDFEDNILQIIYNYEMDSTNNIAKNLDKDSIKKMELLLEKSFLGDRLFYNKFMGKVKDLIIETKNCNINLQEVVKKFKGKELTKERLGLEKKVEEILGKEKGRKLFEHLNERLTNSYCTLNIYEEIDNFSKKNKITINGKNIKKLTDVLLKSNKETESNKINYLKTKYKISDKELLQVKNNKKLEVLLSEKGVTEEHRKIFMDSLKKQKKADIAIERNKLIKSTEIKKIIEEKKKGKSNEEIMRELEKNNKELSEFNKKVEKGIDTLSEKSKAENVKPETPRESAPEKKRQVIENSGGSYSSVVNSLNDPEFKGRIDLGSNSHLTKTESGDYILKIGKEKFKSKEKKDILNILELKDLGLDFLFPHMRKIERAIKNNPKNIGISFDVKNGLDNEEKKNFLKIIGNAFIPGFNENATDIRNEFNISNINAKISSPKNKDQKMKHHTGKFESIKSLADFFCSDDKSKKDGSKFNIDKLLERLSS
ncbi:MAG: hypothetical protein PHS92_00915 [Candidatus Gracilibacteria bacterium]|nr:hypothetical protein [Candidatus Gracilibacteria bacterium]